MLYSFKGSRPEPLPFRIALPNGFTRTDPSTFSASDIEVAGYEGPYESPPHNPVTEQLDWISGKFVVSARSKTSLEIKQIDLIATANEILAAVATGDADLLASLLSTLLNARDSARQ